jgi:hypothetical protein
MANLAIKGHKTRGKEVIEILEMLGGTNSESCWGVFENRLYTINAFGIIEDKSSRDNSNYQVYTLEEFLEKFPYKVGDRVRVAEYESEVRISNMYWDGCGVQYEVVTDEVEWYSAKELNEFNEPNKANEEKKINQMSLSNCDLDEVEIVFGDKFELKIKDGKYYAVKKKSLYPKTYEECCKVLNLGEDGNLYTKGHQASLIQDFHILFICRAAYWKIAGERMGLEKPWSPSKNDNVYCIFRFKGEIVKDNFVFGDCLILEFPTEEMRDAFYENFKDLIEQCKKLL